MRLLNLFCPLKRDVNIIGHSHDYSNLSPSSEQADASSCRVRRGIDVQRDEQGLPDGCQAENGIRNDLIAKPSKQLISTEINCAQLRKALDDEEAILKNDRSQEISIKNSPCDDNKFNKFISLGHGLDETKHNIEVLKEQILCFSLPEDLIVEGLRLGDVYQKLQCMCSHEAHITNSIHEIKNKLEKCEKTKSNLAEHTNRCSELKLDIEILKNNKSMISANIKKLTQYVKI